MYGSNAKFGQGHLSFKVGNLFSKVGKCIYLNNKFLACAMVSGKFSASR